MPPAAKPRHVFRCTECGATSPKWAGRCDGCGSWNTIDEEIEPGSRGGWVWSLLRRHPSRRSPWLGVEPMPTDVAELDRVLCGGLVPGSVTLLGGEPGVGKSTLLLQAWPASRAPGGTRAVHLGGGVGPPGPQSRRAARRPAPRALPRHRDDAACGARATSCQVEPAVVVVDSIQIAARPRPQLGPGFGGAGPALRARARELREALGQGRRARRPRHQGGRARRSAGARAHRRHRPLVRGRPRPPLAHACAPPSTDSAPPASSG